MSNIFYVALCDDNKFDLQIITEQLQKLNQCDISMEILPLENGCQLVDLYKKGRRFDLLILDMCMKPLNGIETAKLIRGYDSAVPILIVTASMQFALEGYKVNACRYFLKPIEQEQFLTEIKDIFNSLNQPSRPYYIIHHDKGVTKVRFSDIYYFESNMRNITLHAKNERHQFTGKISKIADQLKPFDFIRVHKSFVVNPQHVANIHKGVITMENSAKIFVSKYRTKEVYDTIMNYTVVDHASG